MQSKPTKSRRRNPGIDVRHSRACRTSVGGECNCSPSYRAWIYDKRSGTKVRRTFSGQGAFSAAKTWRHDALAAVAKGRLQPRTRLTLEEAASTWIDEIEQGKVLSRFRRPYAPGVVRQYRADFKNHILPVLGGAKLQDITADDVQHVIDTLVGEGLSGSRVRGALVPLQALYRRHRRQVLADPTDALDLPEAAGRREQVVSPAEAVQLLDVLGDDDRALWACGFYCGARRGELQALRVSNLRSLDGKGVAYIAIEHSWDAKAGQKEPKSLAGVRDVPMPETLRKILADHVGRTERSGDDFLFGRSATAVFTPSYVRKRSNSAWGKANEERAEKGEKSLPAVTLHVARHCYATWLDAAGISETRSARYLGHAFTTISGRYRHNLDGQLAEDGVRLETWLHGATRGKVVALAQAEVA